MLTIIEQFTQGKSNKPEKNEDMIFISDAYVAVIDGATSKSDGLFQGKTGGRLIAEYIYQELSAANGTENAEELIAQITKKLALLDDMHDLTKQNVHMAASLVIYSVHHRQLWSIGDCQFRINNVTTTNAKKIDTVLSELRSLKIHELLLHNHTVEELLEHDLAREAIMPFLREQPTFENQDDEFGYATLNQMGTIPRIDIYDIPAGTEIILASDGYPYLENTLEASESKLKYILENDPLCYTLYKSTKGIQKGNVSFDDRSYVRFVG